MYKLILFILLYISPVFASGQDPITKITLRVPKFNDTMSKDQVNTLARVIVENANKANLSPYLIASIIAVESAFDTEAYNPTGDYSLAQINYKIWSKEFKRLNRTPLDKRQLVLDSEYAVEVMVEILKILRKRHSRVDNEWYLRYHSGTPKLRAKYKKRLDKVLKTFTN